MKLLRERGEELKRENEKLIPIGVLNNNNLGRKTAQGFFKRPVKDDLFAPVAGDNKETGVGPKPKASYRSAL